MNVLIVEDEGIAAERLIALIRQLEPTISVVGEVDSVKSAVRWIQGNAAPDLAFFDIQLADGHSFEIFEQVQVSCPIIFTTAYDQYAIQAFKVNSIDYLLKPIKKDDLARALQKFKSTTQPLQSDMAALLALMQQQTQRYKERFVIKVGEHLKQVNTPDVALFFSAEKATYAQTFTGQRHLLDHTLDQVESMVNPTDFFRISRKYVVNLKAITDIIAFTNSRLKLRLPNYAEEDVIVARERVGDFKAWLDR
jgi:DNA-binding LytR/AlgR family response regulator